MPEPIALFQRGDFTLASGAKASWKIECDALTRDDWDGLAEMLMDYIPSPFGRVVGVPRGGIPFADALSRFANPVHDYSVLVVDDVWTTGGSMRRFIESTPTIHPSNVMLLRAVAFARNPVPVGVTALFSVPR